jgi:hypothetical protein
MVQKFLCLAMSLQQLWCGNNLYICARRVLGSPSEGGLLRHMSFIAGNFLGLQFICDGLKAQHGKEKRFLRSPEFYI